MATASGSKKTTNDMGRWRRLFVRWPRSRRLGFAGLHGIGGMIGAGYRIGSWVVGVRKSGQGYGDAGTDEGVLVEVFVRCGLGWRSCDSGGVSASGSFCRHCEGGSSAGYPLELQDAAAPVLPPFFFSLLFFLSFPYPFLYPLFSSARPVFGALVCRDRFQARLVPQRDDPGAARERAVLSDEINRGNWGKRLRSQTRRSRGWIEVRGSERRAGGIGTGCRLVFW